MERHATVMKLLIRRYVTAEQRKRDEFGITEDDVMEIRQDISAMRYELIDILRNNGMKTPKVEKGDAGEGGCLVGGTYVLCTTIELYIFYIFYISIYYRNITSLT